MSPNRMSRYSIDEMMVLKDNASIDIGRFTISALENNLLRRHKTNSAPDKELGSKSSSESRRGDHSTTTSDDSYHKLNSQISSETDDAKESKSSSGFVNFLKRHASPKHQRVTPGGKVVHVLGKTPPPEFKPPPIKKSDDCPPKSTRSTIKSAVSHQVAAESRSSQKSGESSNSNSVRFDASATQEKFTREGARQQKSSSSGEGIPLIGGFYPAIHSLPQFQVPMMGTDIYRPQPLAWMPAFGPIIQVLPTGQDVVSMQGYLGQPSWMMAADPSTGSWYPALPQPFVGQNSLFQSLPQQQTAPLVQPGSLFSTFSLPDPHLAIPNAYSFPTYNPSTGQAPSQFSPYAVSFTPSGTDPSIQRSLQDLLKEHQSLSGQLANLDRYMAMHVFEMDAETKQNLVEQRRNLVKELDAARKYKEHLESGIKLPSSINDASLPAAPVF